MGKSIFAIFGVMTLFVVGCVGFFSLMAGGIFIATAGLGDSANGFFESVSNKNLTVAREYLAVDYSNSLTDEELAKFVQDYRLDQYSSSFWKNRSIDNENGHLEGTITTGSGETIPVVMDLVYEMGDWKIMSLNPQNNPTPAEAAVDVVEHASDETLSTNMESELPPEVVIPSESEHPLVTEPDLKSESQVVSDFEPMKTPAEITPEEAVNAVKVSSPTSTSAAETVSVLNINDIPSEDVAESMAKLWTTEFCKGVGSKDFTEFHGQLSPELQEKFPLEEFTKVFQEFIDRQIDLSWVSSVEAVFDRRPSLDSEGVLSLVGHFPADPRVNFQFAFARIEEEWKPVRVNLEVPASENKSKFQLPDLSEIEQAVITATRDFGQSVADKDFAAFHGKTYSKFQEKFSVEKFTEYFKSFFKADADLSWLKDTKPVFDVSPAINFSGFVTVEGHFPSEPRVNFRYIFVLEDEVWKVSTVNLSIPKSNDKKAGN